MSDFKETCIWMSYRYAIGRKSITSVHHARDIAMHIDWIPEDRRKFTSQDIIHEVNDNVRWYDNVYVDYTGVDEVDAFSVLFQWFMDNPQEDAVKFFLDHKWYINLANQSVTFEERETKPVRNEHGFYYEANIFTDYSDYKDWVSLSKYLTGATHIATVDYNGEVSEIPVIEWYNCYVQGKDVKLEKCYTSEKEFPQWHIAPEYIVDIKKL